MTCCEQNALNWTMPSLLGLLKNDLALRARTSSIILYIATPVCPHFGSTNSNCGLHYWFKEILFVNSPLKKVRWTLIVE